MAAVKSYTAAELAEWQSRWTGGDARYASAKTRITNNANSFNALVLANQFNSALDTNNEIYWHTESVVTEGYYEAGAPTYSPEPYKEAMRMRDAAFKRLCTGENTYDAKLKSFILSQVGQASADFSNATMWTMDSGGSSYIPMFQVSEWLNRFARAYEYCDDLFSAGEQSTIETYLLNAAEYFRDLQATKFDIIWTDRYNDNYTPTGYMLSVHNTNVARYNFRTHIGGKVASPPLVWRYHNRHCSSIRAIAAIAYMLNNAALQEFVKRLFKEFVKFWQYSDGLTIEYERGFEEAKPEAGYYYNIAVTIEQLLGIADLAARAGDTSLFDYTTSDGYFNTGGAPKNIWKVIQTACRLKRNRLEPGSFYDPITNSSSIYSGIRVNLGVFDDTIQANRKIDGYDPYDTFSHVPKIYVKEHYFALYNCYYQDTYVRESYLRCFTDAGTISIAPSGSFDNDQGSWGTEASILIQRWGIDSILNPYSGQSAPDLAVYSLVPSTAAEGDTIIINGLGFDDVEANNTVTFNGVSATVKAATTTVLQVVVPAGDVSGVVSVTVAGVTANYSSFTEQTSSTPITDSGYFGVKSKRIKNKLFLA